MYEAQLISIFFNYLTDLRIEGGSLRDEHRSKWSPLNQLWAESTLLPGGASEFQYSYDTSEATRTRGPLFTHMADEIGNSKTKAALRDLALCKKDINQRKGVVMANNMVSLDPNLALKNMQRVVKEVRKCLGYPSASPLTRFLTFLLFRPLV